MEVTDREDTMMENGTLDDLVTELQRLLVAAETAVYEHTEALEEATFEALRARAMLNAAGAIEKPEEEKPDSIQTRVMNAIERHEQTGVPALPDVPGSFVVTDLKGAMHETSVRSALKLFIEEGLVREVGKKPVGRARAPVAYARV